MSPCSSSGTLKSTRTSTRFPRTSMSRTVFFSHQRSRSAANHASASSSRARSGAMPRFGRPIDGGMSRDVVQRARSPRGRRGVREQRGRLERHAGPWSRGRAGGRARAVRARSRAPARRRWGRSACRRAGRRRRTCRSGPRLPQIPSTSSRIWNARPSLRPYSAKRDAAICSRPPSRAPAARPPKSGRPSCPRSRSCSPVGVSASAVGNLRSRCWPSHRVSVVSSSKRIAARTRSGGTRARSSRSSSTCASANMPSPALIASSLPQTRHTVGRPCRCGSRPRCRRG